MLKAGNYMNAVSINKTLFVTMNAIILACELHLYWFLCDCGYILLRVATQAVLSASG